MNISKIIFKVIPHLAIIMTAMIITLCVLDYLNPLMGFLTRGISKGLILIWGSCLTIFFSNKIARHVKKAYKNI